MRKDGLKDFEKVVAMLETVTVRGDTLPSASCLPIVDDKESLGVDELLMERLVATTLWIIMRN
jgi:hypothetical protein